MSPVTIFKRDVYRSNDFKQMTGDHSDEWRNTEKKHETREEKGFKNQHQRRLGCVSILCAACVYVSLSIGRKI